MTRIPQLFTWYPFSPIMWERGRCVLLVILPLSLVIYISYHK